jgi:hypothetical protein
MAKTKRKKPVPIVIAEPTPEQQAHGAFHRVGMAYRRIPVIDTMAQCKKLTARQFNGLARYRDVAIAEERSLIEDSVGKMMRGALGGGEVGKSPNMIRTAAEMQRLEAALGSLRDIARAVAVDDVTVSQWATNRGGTTSDGKPKRGWLKDGMKFIQDAGDKLAGAVGA